MVRAAAVLCLLSVGCVTGESLDSALASSGGGGIEAGEAESAGEPGAGGAPVTSGGGEAAAMDATHLDALEGSLVSSDASDTGALGEGGACGAQAACAGNLKCECCSPGLKCICTTECMSDGDCKISTDRCAKPHGDPGFCAADKFCGQ